MTPHWGKCCWPSQGQNTWTTEGTWALLSALNFETHSLLVRAQISITTVSFSIHIFQMFSTIPGDRIIWTTSNVFLRWVKQLGAYRVLVHRTHQDWSPTLCKPKLNQICRHLSMVQALPGGIVYHPTEISWTGCLSDTLKVSTWKR